MCGALLMPPADRRASGRWSGVGRYARNISTSSFRLVCPLKTGKNRRLKQAKEEAQAEIEQYRLQREKEFKAKEAAVCVLDHSLLPTQPLSLAFGVTCPESSPRGGMSCWRSVSLTAFF